MVFKYLHRHLDSVFDVKFNRDIDNYGTTGRNDIFVCHWQSVLGNNNNLFIIFLRTGII